MKWFTNLKIRAKLGVSFVVIILGVIGVSAGMFIVSSVATGNFTYLEEFPRARRTQLSEITIHFRTAQQYLLQSVAYQVQGQGQTSGRVDELANLVAIEIAGLNDAATRFISSVNNDPRLGQYIIGRPTGYRDPGLYLADINRVLGLVSDWQSQAANPAFEASRQGNPDVAAQIILDAEHIAARLISEIDALAVITNNSIESSAAETITFAFQIVFIIIGLALTVMVLTFAIMFILNRTLSRPILKAATTLREVAKGNFNINMDRSSISKDEIGEVTNDIFHMVDVIKGMADDVSALYHRFTVVGDTEYRVDENKYQNAFKSMMADMNKIMSELIDNISISLDVLSRISGGDFDVQVKDMPGKRMILPQTIREVVQSLNDLNEELNTVIQSVVNGDLSNRINADEYTGEWRKIMVGLNDITIAVDGPIRATEVYVNEMRKGNFDSVSCDKKIAELGISADPSAYKGVFASMSNSINATMKDVASYINELESTLAGISRGDLRNNITREYVGSFDLIKRSVNNINSILHKTMSEISVAADQVLQGANQISGSASSLSGGTQQQANSVQELTESISTINQQTIQNAENAQTANDLSKKSTDNAQQGNIAVRQMVAAMTQIKESSNNISQIVKTIQEIAFQTNLLALNASVEAARAGEHGKGFAVVADEVRSLAGRSQEAAEQTTSLILDSISRVDVGSRVAQATTESLDSIVASASEVLGVISKISDSSKEQADAIANVSGGIEQISKVVQNNSAVSEETAAASEELSSQAEMLRQLVAFFKL